MRELNTIVFADDVVFIHNDPSYLQHILLVAEKVFRSWSLKINVCKLRERLLPEILRVHLYNVRVLPILPYNLDTWVLTDHDISSLEVFHRRHLRRVFRTHFPQHISKADLYKSCNTKWLRISLTQSILELFGHIFRRSQPIPAQLNMLRYYDSTGQMPAYRGRTTTCLPTILGKDIRLTIAYTLRLRNTADLHALSISAHIRARWKVLTRQLCTSQELIYQDKETVRRKGKLASTNKDSMPSRKRT
uniref:AlNc14C60G4397 protein n=1 Tax=Albugo laibachii Nc14 TaxID=890382 RepID=F0WCR9_9STRA|nr:AlNc14C60G4397 [Albugo laibachii Nc14]|eukprot:CCA18934.1 AlNc14C60G4397 [Albugo laibachii Nc14]